MRDKLIQKHKARGVLSENLWPECDSETGMFAGLYAAQLKHWFQHFDPSQFVVIPMDCYTTLGPSAPLKVVAEASGLALGKSLADLDPSLRSEHEKRLKAISGGGDKAGSANRHGEQPIPIGAAKQIKAFFRHEGKQLRRLLQEEFPTVKVAGCPVPHFFEPCNATHCLPSYDETVEAIDKGIAEQRQQNAAAAGSARPWEGRPPLTTLTTLPLKERKQGQQGVEEEEDDDNLASFGGDDEYSDVGDEEEEGAGGTGEK